MHLVPVLGWAHAGDAIDYDEIDDADKVPTECRDPKAFAMDVEGDSMEPKVHHGDRLIVSPSSPLYNDCYVVARFAQQGGVVLRKFEQMGNEVTLIPCNERYPVKSYDIDQFDWIYPVWGRWTQLYKSNLSDF